MTGEWFCDFAGGELGPLSFRQLKAMADEGRLRPQDRIKQGREGAWTEAVRVGGLFTSDGDGAAAAVQPARAAVKSAEPMPRKGAKPAKAKPVASKAVRPLDLPVAQPAPQPPEPPEPPPRATPVAPIAAAETPVAVRAAAAPAAHAAPQAKIPPAGARKAGRPAAATAASPAGQFAIAADSPTARVTGRGAPSGPAGAPAPKKRRDHTATIVIVLIAVLVGLGATAAALTFWMPNWSSETSTITLSDIAPPDPKMETFGQVDPLAAEPGETTGAAQPADTTSATPTPSPSPTAPADDREWTDASNQSIRRGDVSVKIVSAAVERPRGIRAVAPNPHLVLQIELHNNHATKKLDYISWSNAGTHTVGMQLVDNLGNEYRTRKFQGALEGQIQKGSIYPTESLRDVLVFERPIASPKLAHLRLRLPAMAFGERGILQFQIPASWIKEAGDADNPFDERPTTPQRPAEPERPRPPAEIPPGGPGVTRPPDREPDAREPGQPPSIFEDMPELFPELNPGAGQKPPADQPPQDEGPREMAPEQPPMPMGDAL